MTFGRREMRRPLRELRPLVPAGESRLAKSKLPNANHGRETKG